MTLHIFNPEHDLALAANLANFTAPHAGRQLRADLGFIPALWAGADDVVLVDDAACAEKLFRRLVHRPFERFVEKRQLPSLPVDAVSPWGWDLALRAFLLRQGVDAGLLPTEAQIADLRLLSHRRQAADLLRGLQQQGTVGEAVMAVSPDTVSDYLAQWRTIVLKAPWSSSGRGIRFVDTKLSSQLEGWIANTIAQQGGVMVEPHYSKVKDFGMEFESDGEGRVDYCGLSLFHTSNGAYTGNIIASESEKEEMISAYISMDLLAVVRQKICDALGTLYAHRYQGSLGVDMMVVSKRDRQGFLLHPCVEINLRRTMGHVALSVPPSPSGFPHIMSILFRDNSYKLKIRKL